MQIPRPPRPDLKDRWRNPGLLSPSSVFGSSFFLTRLASPSLPDSAHLIATSHKKSVLIVESGRVVLFKQTTGKVADMVIGGWQFINLGLLLRIGKQMLVRRGSKKEEIMVTCKAKKWLCCLVVSIIASASIGSEAVAKTLTVSKSIGVGTSPVTAVITPNGAEVYVSNSGGNTVSVISTASDAVTATVRVGSVPDALAVSPDGSKVYVGQNGGDVSVIDTVTKAVTTISAGAPVRDLAITPDGTKIYLAMEFSGLEKIDISTGTVSTISTIVCPEGVAVTPSGEFLYVNYQCFGPGGSAGHDAIGKFDVATDSFIKGITGFPNVGTKIAVSPDGARFWATDEDSCSSPFYDHKGCPVIPQGVVNVLSTSTDTLLQSLGVPGRVAFFPDNSLVVLGGSQLLVLRSLSREFFGLVNVAGSGSLAVTRNGRKAYAPVPSRNVVEVIRVTE